jgi:syntaxin 1B/2/3
VCRCREVVQRRVYTVTGEVPGEAQVEDLIERGESEQVFQQAIKSGGRLEVRLFMKPCC